MKTTILIAPNPDLDITAPELVPDITRLYAKVLDLVHKIKTLNSGGADLQFNLDYYWDSPAGDRELKVKVTGAKVRYESASILMHQAFDLGRASKVAVTPYECFVFLDGQESPEELDEATNLFCRELHLEKP